jgi:DNA-binding MarR family transcriptional regulator
MSLNAQKTSITNFRILKKLRLQGWITLRVGETDERFKWVELSKLALRYFALHDKCLMKALSAPT